MTLHHIQGNRSALNRFVAHVNGRRIVTAYAILMAAAMLACERGKSTGRGIGPASGVDHGDSVGTVLQFVCDIPEDVGPLDRSYLGRIDWSGGSEPFAFHLSRKSFDVRLKHVVDTDEPVRIFFTIDEDPGVATKFSYGEWFYRGRLQRDADADSANTYSVPLSGFREARQFSRVRRPCTGP